MRPNREIKAHWNNEVEDLALWLDPPEGWAVDDRYHTVPNPPGAVSHETRKIEFEVRSPKKTSPGKVTMPGYALYYVCEGEKGTCLYRRQDVAVEVDIREAVP